MLPDIIVIIAMVCGVLALVGGLIGLITMHKPVFLGSMLTLGISSAIVIFNGMAAGGHPVVGGAVAALLACYVLWLILLCLD